MRYLSIVCVVAAGVVLAGCKGLDEGLLQDPPGGDGGADGAVADAGRDAASLDASNGVDAAPPGDACVESAEICNGLDDDCDGDVDEGGDEWCGGIILNAVAACERVASEYLCVRIRCNDGYRNCDGKPENGCEDPCLACGMCPDDAGADDGG